MITDFKAGSEYNSVCVFQNYIHRYVIIFLFSLGYQSNSQNKIIN
jgi:hypothetical protein